ncbi:hypothetical protein GJAV_G00273190 [Gymnothorax javanicus]|nr:hypothetical protein GJAV_G00273190 [Gymnothorax javanicus]
MSSITPPPFLSVPPQVALLQKDPSSPVTCHVTGFPLNLNILVTWQKNKQDLDVDVELGRRCPMGMELSRPDLT